ncbi:MAG TPA: dockerin type I repeat-containing protein [Terriglobales bacterium]|nr:dockerin type I repeat-containing protein [Terriglobales bacterium]
MRRKLLLVLLVISVVSFFSKSGYAQDYNHDYALVPVDLEIGPGDSTVEVDIHFYAGDEIKSFFVPLFAEGTSNPVLDTVLTGGLASANPPGFAPPSLVSIFRTKIVNPYGPPNDPLYFWAYDTVGYAAPNYGLYCRMFYKVSGPGTLTFRTAVHSTLGKVHMIRYEDGDSLPLSWPAAGQVGSFNVVPYTNKYSLEPADLQIAPGDSIVQININISSRDTIGLFQIPLYAEGTSNPVLDTILTGGLGDQNPPGFASPSLVNGFSDKVINPYGPPADPLVFMAKDLANPLRPDTGLICKMFYKVTTYGSLNFRTAVHSTFGSVSMNRRDSTSTPINWPAQGEIANFTVVGGFFNEYILDPVDLEISPCDSTVEVDIKINVIDELVAFVVPLFAEGTSNPVLDTVLTGGMTSANPPGFAPPSLVSSFTQRIVEPGTPLTVPMAFVAVDFQGGVYPPAYGIFCRMFYKVSGPGILTFRTAVHPTAGPVAMFTSSRSVPVNWPDSGQVGSFNVVLRDIEHGNVNCDGQINVTDVIYIISYLFKGGPSPRPLDLGDANCDGKVTVTDVVYLINYLFKSGPPPPC